MRRETAAVGEEIANGDLAGDEGASQLQLGYERTHSCIPADGAITDDAGGIDAIDDVWAWIMPLATSQRGRRHLGLDPTASLSCDCAPSQLIGRGQGRTRQAYPDPHEDGYLSRQLDQLSLRQDNRPLRFGSAALSG